MNNEIETENKDNNLDEKFHDLLIIMIISSILFLVVVLVGHLFGVDVLKILEDSMKI